MADRRGNCNQITEIKVVEECLKARTYSASIRFISFQSPEEINKPTKADISLKM